MHRCETFTIPLIVRFSEDVQLRCNLVLQKRDLAFVGRAATSAETHTAEYQTNASAITISIDGLLAQLGEVKAMRLKPLAELRQRIRLADASFEQTMARGFPCCERITGEPNRLYDLRFTEIRDPNPARLPFKSKFSR